MRTRATLDRGLASRIGQLPTSDFALSLGRLSLIRTPTPDQFFIVRRDHAAGPPDPLQQRRAEDRIPFGESGGAQRVGVHRAGTPLQEDLGHQLAQRGGVHHPVA